MTHRTIRLGLAVAAALALQVPVEAQSDEVQVLAKPNWYQDRDWLWIANPDREGNYGVRISIKDLDLTAASGEGALRRRVYNSISRACWVLSSGQNRVQEGECIHELRAKFQPRVASAIASARSGERMAFLELKPPTRRSVQTAAAL